MKDNSIEINEETVVVANSTVPLPVNFVSVGTVEHDSLKVYIKQDVYKKIEKFAKEDMSKEVGSILLGQFVEEKNSKTVIISDYIEAKYTDASAATLTFTHETWDYVYKEKDKKYPDKKIVGWQHTHPGYGIFLSNYDIFIQENFFNLPWQTAYVVDPIADTRGFFEWKNNKVCKMSGFYVYDEVGKEIKLSKAEKPAKKPFSVSTVILSCLLFVSVMLTISMKFEKNNLTDRLNDALGIIDSQRIISDSNADLPPNYNAQEGFETFSVYTVQAGDCLEDICRQYGLDFVQNIQKIMRMNGITDINKIYAGQKLYIPIQ